LKEAVEQMKNKEKEIIEGYAVESSVWVGNKRFVFAISEDQKEPMRYLKCIAIPEELFIRYEEAFVCDDYFDAMKLYTDDIVAEIELLKNARDQIGLENVNCFQKEDLIPINSSMNLSGQIVAIDETAISDGYRDIAHQLFYVNSGFGVSAYSRGNACFGWNLYSGEKGRIERYDIIGIVPADKLPDFAKKTMEVIRKQEKEKSNGER